MNQKLIDRYIRTVTRRLPPKVRGDVEQELASLISDMLEARCGAAAGATAIAPEEKDIRAVLSELGAPGQLAARYKGQDDSLPLVSVHIFAARAGWPDRFVNTSGHELVVYADTAFKTKIGMLYRDALCYCNRMNDGCVMLLYKVSSAGIFKVGFTDYVQGVLPGENEPEMNARLELEASS